MYKDAETSWAIESAPLRKKKEAPLCQKIVKFTVSLYLHEVNEKKNWKINCESCPPTRTLLYNNLYP